ncbi:MAG TPA: HlyD family efflux transporter periplasmic adaptor subunit [Acidobacteriota bacterium]|nr:HlyD family efflux transporter periplasmic adaptor subunit [Acidobacteriota bacterium]
MNRKRLIFALLTVAVIAGVVLSLYRIQLASAAITEKDLVTVELVDFPVLITATGVLEATSSVSIGPPQIPGEYRFRLARMIEEGTEVSEGDFLLEFDTSDTARRMREETANLQRVQEEYQKKRSDFDIQLREMKLAVEEARADYGKLENKLMYQVELESALTVEETRIRRDAAKKRLELLEAKLKHFEESGRLDLQISRSNENHYRNRLDALMDAMEKLTVRAPVSGVVIYKRDWNNEPREIGSNIFALDTVLEIPDLDTIRAKLYVDEMDAGKVQPGQEASIFVDALQGRAFSGTVTSVSAILKQLTYDRPQKVTEAFVELNKDSEFFRQLRPGMSLKAQVQVGLHTDALAIPLSSIQERDGRSFVQVWKPEKEDWEWREITLRTNDGLTALVESGLQANERIRTRPRP